MIKHSRGKLSQFVNNNRYVGKTFQFVHNDLFTNYEEGKCSLVKHSWLVKIHKKHESFPLKHIITYGM